MYGVSMNKETKETLGIIGQYSALIMVGFGLLFEIQTGAHLGYTLVTTGAIMLCVWTKLRGK